MSIRRGSHSKSKKQKNSDIKSRKIVPIVPHMNLEDDVNIVENEIIAIREDTLLKERSRISHNLYRLRDKVNDNQHLSDKIYKLSEKLRQDTPIPLWIVDNYDVPNHRIELIRTGNVEIEHSRIPEHGGELYLPYVKTVSIVNSIKKDMNGLHTRKIKPTDDSSTTAINIDPKNIQVGKIYEFDGSYANPKDKNYKLALEKVVDEDERVQISFLDVGNNKYDAMDVMKNVNKNQRLIDVNREITELRNKKKELSGKTKDFRQTDLYRKGGGLAILAFVGTPTEMNKRLKELQTEKNKLIR